MKLYLATAIHNFKWLKMLLFAKFKSPTYISVSKFKAYFIFNNWLYMILQQWPIFEQKIDKAKDLL